ncbi:MAG TPA: hypothetical protein DDZ80_00350 [Cyanobacteria bacterium UBA8803]|nr:hypothetical protein [Cyanobacteria bacterium UBA9273]HBL57066.1 hypothetical protein [Cyanobacteria bacterium UBA8803]
MSEFIQPEFLKALRPRQATPNLSLTVVPIDQHTSFELWTPKWTIKTKEFTPLEIELLRRDSPRVARIMSKLVWLMGAICIAEDDWEVGDRQPIYDWDNVVEFVRREGRSRNPLVTRVIFSPQTIIPIYDKGRKQVGRIPPQAWEVSPPHWSIIFDDLIPVEQSFQLKQGGDWVSVEIWTGKPMRREVRSGQFYVEYHDLYASNRLGKF